jgi:tRNA modification GTPase
VTDPSIDTIAAVATPAGRGSVGIIRVSGPNAKAIAEALLGSVPAARQARFRRFRDAAGDPIDEGVALWFPAPASFTGEDVLELQGHGGPLVLDMLLERVTQLGARRAEPGEFSRRAFLNDKLDLAQAEAIADLIDSHSRAAARAAMRSLSGVFSDRVHALVDAITRLRMYVEAAIDFPEEEIDFLADDRVTDDLAAIVADLADLQARAHGGRALRDGLTLVIAGLPNAGKSSLLNALTGEDSAIVTAVPGTTRDLLRERIEIDGLPVLLIDTAGLRAGSDVVEQEGIRRARAQIAKADHALWVYDPLADPRAEGMGAADLPPDLPITRVRNKIDLTGEPAGLDEQAPADRPEIRLSSLTGEGIDVLRTYLKERIAGRVGGEGEFSARRRHLDALTRAAGSLAAGQQALQQGRAGELLAEDLRQVQLALSTITGEFSADDLLGEIFSSFCIGK